jgi:signal peptidase I
VIDVSRTRNRLGALGALAAVVVLWVLLAPTQLGGPTSFAQITGVSMEPRLHSGDLVVVRRSGGYHVGEVVAYRSRTLGRIVLHRIVAIHGDRYTFKGDNNDFVDPAPAARGDLVGREWIRIPGAGRWFLRLHEPWVASLLAVLAVLVLFGTGRRRWSGGPRARRAAAFASFRVPPGLQPYLRQLIPVGVVAAGVYLVLTAVAVGMPTQRVAPVPDLYADSGTFAYGGAAPVSAAYPTGRVASGGKVFTKLVHDVDVSFRWRLATSRSSAVAGTAGLDAVVSDGSGWSRRLRLAPARSFVGGTAAVHGRLDIAALQRLVAHLEAETGAPSTTYGVSIAPRVRYAGTVAGQHVGRTYAPTLDLVLTDEALQLANDGQSTPSLVRSEPQPGEAPVANRVGLGPLHLRVATARVLGVLGVVLSLLAVGGCVLALRRGREEDPVDRAIATAGQSVVPIVEERRGARLVDVQDLAGLLRIARRYDRILLYAQRTAAYLVEDGDIVYRWRRPVPGGEPPDPWFGERRDWSTRPWGPRADDPPSQGVGTA